MKKNKIIISLLGVAGALSPVMFAASCGNSSSSIKGEKTGPKALLANNAAAAKRFDQKPNNKVKIAVTWSQNSPQMAALESIINVYNEKMKNTKGFLKVEVSNVGSGYGAGADLVTKSLGTKDTFYNAIFNYANVASNLASYGMLLNFNDGSDYSITKDNFEDGFWSENESTSGISNTEGSWILPLAKSGQVSAMDASILGYVLETLKAKGANVTLENADQIIEKSQAKRATIKKIWGEVRSDLDSANIIPQNYEVNASTFSDLKKLLEFATIAQQLFTISKDSTTKDVPRMIGIDDISGILSNVAYSYFNGDADKMYASAVKNPETGTIDINYSKFTQASSEASTFYAEVFGVIKKALAAGALKINGAGSYTSNDTTYHKSMIGISSTAGYNYNFIEANRISGEFKYKNIALSKKEVYSALKNKNNDAAIQSGKHVNPILPFGTAKVGKYDYVAADEDTSTKVQALISSLPTKSGKVSENTTDRFIIIPSKDTKRNDAFKDVAESDDFKKLGLVKRGSTSNDTYNLYYIKNLAGFTYVEYTTADVLEKPELLTYTAPTTWDGGDKKQSVYIQGPSLLGIHANDKEDSALRMFVHWFITSKDKYDFTYNIKNDSKTENAKPYQLFEKVSSYVLPVKDSDNKADLFNDSFIKNAFESFKKVADDQYLGYSDPGDPKANTIREAISGAYRGVYDKYLQGNGSEVSDYPNEIINVVQPSISGN